MNLIYLQTFCAVARWENFTRAADELGYAQSSVTTQIQKLEEHYGVVLFERLGRKMQLTQAGEALLQYAREILRLYEESREVLTQQATGTMTIGTIETLAAFYLPPLLQTFQASHPHLTLSLQSGTEPSIIQAVRERQYDFGLILDLPYSKPDLACITLKREELVVIAHPSSPFSSLPHMTIHELENQRLILTEEGCTYRAQLLQALKQHSTRHEVACEFGSIEAIKQCVKFNLGLALLPRITVRDEVAKGGLVAIPFVHPEITFYTQLIYHREKWQSHAMRDFLDLVVQKEYSGPRQ